MRKRGVLLIAAVMCLLAADKPADEAAKEKKKLEGTWAFVSVEVNGEKVADNEIENFKMVIAGDQVTFKVDQEVKGTIKTLDPRTTPRLIDLDFKEGPIKGTIEGIYQLDGDTLKLCVNNSPDVKNRPSEFSAKAGSPHFLLVFKREKS